MNLFCNLMQGNRQNGVTIGIHWKLKTNNRPAKNLKCANSNQFDAKYVDNK